MSFLEFFKSDKESGRGAGGESAGRPELREDGRAGAEKRRTTLLGGGEHGIAPKDFSERSQRSLVEESNAQNALERCEVFIKINKERLRVLGLSGQYQVEFAASGGGLGDYNLPRVLDDQSSVQRQLSAYEEHAGALRAKLAALRKPSQGEKEERRERQYRLARLANLRLRVDRELDERIEGLQKLLNERRELGRAMKAEAKEIELTFDGDYFDEARFEELGELLPANCSEQSTEWVLRFFGKRQDGEPRTVTAVFVTIRETLASPNFFLRGQEVVLTGEEIRSLGRAVGPAVPSQGADL